VTCQIPGPFPPPAHTSFLCCLPQQRRCWDEAGPLRVGTAKAPHSKPGQGHGQPGLASLPLWPAPVSTHPQPMGCSKLLGASLDFPASHHPQFEHHYTFLSPVTGTSNLRKFPFPGRLCFKEPQLCLPLRSLLA
jgi:hypothetical protein